MNFSARISALRKTTLGKRIDPGRDWLIILSVSALLLVLIAAWNVWLYESVVNGTSGSTPSATQAAPGFSAASLQQVHDQLQKRAAREASFATGTYPVADPSQ